MSRTVNTTGSLRKTDALGNVVDCRQMIVRFIMWRATTEVYRSRDKHSDIRFYIDQTKRRFNLRKMAVEFVKDKPEVDFVFVDINCNLCIRFKNNSYKFFNSEDELNNLFRES